MRVNRPKECAFEIAVELAKVKLSNSQLNVSKEGGKELSDFIEEVYNNLV